MSIYMPRFLCPIYKRPSREYILPSFSTRFLFLEGGRDREVLHEMDELRYSISAEQILTK